jgi:hypothetical protein
MAGSRGGFNGSPQHGRQISLQVIGIASSFPASTDHFDFCRAIKGMLRGTFGTPGIRILTPDKSDVPQLGCVKVSQRFCQLTVFGAFGAADLKTSPQATSPEQVATCKRR